MSNLLLLHHNQFVSFQEQVDTRQMAPTFDNSQHPMGYDFLYLI